MASPPASTNDTLTAGSTRRRQDGGIARHHPNRRRPLRLLILRGILVLATIAALVLLTAYYATARHHLSPLWTRKLTDYQLPIALLALSTPSTLAQTALLLLPHLRTNPSIPPFMDTLTAFPLLTLLLLLTTVPHPTTPATLATPINFCAPLPVYQSPHAYLNLDPVWEAPRYPLKQEEKNVVWTPGLGAVGVEGRFPGGWKEFGFRGQGGCEGWARWCGRARWVGVALVGVGGVGWAASALLGAWGLVVGSRRRRRRNGDKGGGGDIDEEKKTLESA